MDPVDYSERIQNVRMLRYFSTREDDKSRIIKAIDSKDVIFETDYTASKKTAYVKASRKHYVGMIVGKKGTNIMNKRNETCCDVQNPQQEDEPVFTVSCDKFEGLWDMCIWILRQDDKLSGKENNNGEKIEVRIRCCPKYVGLLVGQSGDTIKDIKTQSRCSIQSPPRSENIKFFAVTGSYSEVQHAYKLMQQLIYDKYATDSKNSKNCLYRSCGCDGPCEELRYGIEHGSPLEKVRSPVWGCPAISHAHHHPLPALRAAFVTHHNNLNHQYHDLVQEQQLRHDLVQEPQLRHDLVQEPQLRNNLLQEQQLRQYYPGATHGAEDHVGLSSTNPIQNIFSQDSSDNANTPFPLQGIMSEREFYSPPKIGSSLYNSSRSSSWNSPTNQQDLLNQASYELNTTRYEQDSERHCEPDQAAIIRLIQELNLQISQGLDSYEAPAKRPDIPQGFRGYEYNNAARVQSPASEYRFSKSMINSSGKGSPYTTGNTNGSPCNSGLNSNPLFHELFNF